MWNMAQANDLDKTQFSEQVQTILICSEVVVTHPKWGNKVEGREYLLYVLEIINYIFCQIQYFKEVASQVSTKTYCNKNNVHTTIVWHEFSEKFDCIETSWQTILSLLYENSQISVIILSNWFCVFWRIWGVRSPPFPDKNCQTVFESVFSSFNSTHVINCMIYTYYLLIAISIISLLKNHTLAEPWVERFQQKDTLECDSRWKWRQYRARWGTSSTHDANAALNQICSKWRDKLLEVKSNTWIVADLVVDDIWRDVIFRKMHSLFCSAIIMVNIDLKLDPCNIKKAGTFWAFSNYNVGSPMDWDIFYLPRP